MHQADLLLYAPLSKGIVASEMIAEGVKLFEQDVVIYVFRSFHFTEPIFQSANA